MDRIMVAVAIGMALVFAVGVVLGFLITISMASHRESRLGTVTRRPPDAAAQGARRAFGLGLRNIELRDAEDVRR